MTKGGTTVPTLKAVVDSVGMQMSLRSFDKHLFAYLGGLHLQHENIKGDMLCRIKMTSVLSLKFQLKNVVVSMH